MPTLLSLDIFGLPAHPLLVHGVVVLLPLSASALIALVLVARWRERYGVLTLAGLLVSTVLAFVTKEAGEDLARKVGEPVEHAEWGGRLPWVALALLVVGGGWLVWQLRLWDRGRPARQRENSRTDAARAENAQMPNAQMPNPQMPNPQMENLWAMVVSVVAVVLAMATIAVTVIVGHSGATATWGARASSEAAAGGAPAPTITARDGSYSMDQVALHNTAASCWSAINGDVYDLTGWIQHHPGGPNAIRSICGADGSKGFNNRHAGTKEALAKLPEFKIGTLLR